MLTIHLLSVCFDASWADSLSHLRPGGIANCSSTLRSVRSLRLYAISSMTLLRSLRGRVGGLLAMIMALRTSPAPEARSQIKTRGDSFPPLNNVFL